MSDFVFVEQNDVFRGFDDSEANVEVFGEIAKGDKGDPGRDFQVSGILADVSDLPATQEVGECWLIGTENPYDGYMWDGTQWVNIGPILQGPPGQDGQNYVLTDADKTQIAGLAAPLVETDLQPQIDLLDAAMEKKILYYTSQAVSVATNAQIMRIPASGTSTSISIDTIVLECVFASPSNIASDVTWTSYDGYIVFSGTCKTATTANIVLGTKGN